MGYRLLADGLLVVHGSYLAFLVIGGFMAWRWRRVVWAHLLAIAWAVPAVAGAVPCPLTDAEKWLQERGGEERYPGGFIEYYLDGRLWPENYTWAAEIIAFSLIALSYVGLAVIGRRRTRA